MYIYYHINNREVVTTFHPFTPLILLWVKRLKEELFVILFMCVGGFSIFSLY